MVTRIEVAARKLAELTKMITLVSRDGQPKGKVCMERNELILNLDGNHRYTVETLENWIKQAKTAQRRKLV